MEKSRLVNSMNWGEILPTNKYRQALIGLGTYATHPGYETFATADWNTHSGSSYAASKTLSAAYLQQVEVLRSTERKRPMFNNCWHSKFYSFCYPFSFSYWVAPKSRHYQHSFWRVINQDAIPVYADPINWEEVSLNMQAEAYRTMLPRFEGDMSLINSLFELKDFRDVSTALTECVHNVHRLLNIKEGFGHATKLLASARLTDALAIKPTASDFVSLCKDARTIVLDKQEEFRNKGLLPDIRHFSKTLDQSQSLTPRLHGAFSSGAYASTAYGVKRWKRFTATMEGDYGYSLRSGLDAFTKYWGLDLTAEAVWNGLPLSFVLDYVFTIGDSLHAMRKDNNVSYRVKQYSESLLSTATSGWFLTRGSTNVAYRGFCIDDKYFVVDNNTEIADAIVGTYHSLYERVVKVPYYGPFLPRFRIPSKNALINMAALARCFL